MNKQIEEMAKTMHDGCAIVKGTNQCRGEDCLDCAAVTLHEAGYRKQEDVAREIFEELSATIMPLVESHNKIAENTGDILWGHKADGLETALLALKGIIRKYGVK